VSPIHKVVEVIFLRYEQDRVVAGNERIILERIEQLKVKLIDTQSKTGKWLADIAKWVVLIIVVAAACYLVCKLVR